MKHNFKIIIATALIGVLVISSCAKKIDEAYKNPNAAVRQPVDVFITCDDRYNAWQWFGCCQFFWIGW